MTLADLAEHEPEWVAPLTVVFHGVRFHELPRNDFRASLAACGHKLVDGRLLDFGAGQIIWRLEGTAASPLPKAVATGRLWDSERGQACLRNCRIGNRGGARASRHARRLSK